MNSTIKIRLYSYPTCSTCRKAIAWLQARNIDFKLMDIVKTPPSREILEKALPQLEKRKLLFNTNGVSYRNLGAIKVNNMTDQQALDALSLDGKLIKRPFLVVNECFILTGFNIDKWTEFFDKLE